MAPTCTRTLLPLAGLTLLALAPVLQAQPAPPGSAPVVTPGLSSVVSLSQMGTPLVTMSETDSQTGTLAPLSAAVQQSHGGLSHDIWGAGAFASARSGTVDLTYVRSDSNPIGTNVIFGGGPTFRYEFSVDAPTTVTVDYDVLGTESNPGNSWHAMQGFDVNVNGQQQSVNFSLMFFFPPKPYSPQDFQGSFSFSIPAGNSVLWIRTAASATGNLWGGVRTMVGRFGWRIGPPVDLVDLGNGLAGTLGVPQLSGTGSLIAGSPLNVLLGNAPPSASATLILGATALYAPLKGGVLVPMNDVMVFGIPTDANGEIAISTLWPEGLPPGLSLYAQYWMADPGGPLGFAASNGVLALVP